MLINSKNARFCIRNAKNCDLDQLVVLEQEWPEDLRASRETLAFRLEKFPSGFFIAEDESGVIASLISCPYQYQPNKVSQLKNWASVVDECYQTDYISEPSNALYIVSGTSKKSSYGNKIFEAGVHAAIELAVKMSKKYILAAILLPSYKKFLDKHAFTSAVDYVFKQSQGRFVDPLVEKYRRLGFMVPDKNHVLPDYFPHEPSLNYSALVIKSL